MYGKTDNSVYKPMVFEIEEKTSVKKDYEWDESAILTGGQPPTPMQQIDKAYATCKFGRFHIKLLFISFFGCIASILVTNTTSFLLPTAECDLNMNLRQKGILTAMPYFGMFVTSLLSAFLLDTFGRVIFMRIGFCGIFICTVFSALSQNFEMLASAKFVEGVLFSACVTALNSMISEFCHSTIRDRVMISQSSYAAVCQIISPAMAWGILIQDWRVSFLDGRFVLNTWNFYLLAMSLWSLTAFILYSFLPESPKFLVTQKKFAEAKRIIIQMYVSNTGKPAEIFPYPDLWDKEIAEAKHNEKDLPKITTKQKMMNGMKNMRPMLRMPLLKYLSIIGFMQFVILGMYNVLRLWYPQLSTIVEHQRLDKDQNLCALLNVYTANLKHKANVTSEVCVPHISGSETYINSIIIGFVCLLPYFISGVLVNKIGKKILLVSGGIMASITLASLPFVNSKPLMVTLFSMNIALTQSMKSMNQVALVEIFPTTMRSMAMAVVIFTARFGTMTGNVGFPVLLDMNCAVPFYTMSAMMVCLIFCALLLPKKKTQT